MDMSSPDRDQDHPRVFSFESLRFKNIQVMSQGILYRGMLIGADDKDLYLKGHLRWLILPLDRITRIRLEGARESFDPRKTVDPDFYRLEEGKGE